MTDKKPRLPKIGEFVRHQGILLDIKTIQPPTPKPYQEYIFEERCARQELRFKDGTVLDKIATLNDYYGPGTGEETAITELKELAERKGINKNSDVEAVVVREIRQYTARPKPTTAYTISEFVEFKQEQYHSTIKKEEIDIWSSKDGYLLKDEQLNEDVTNETCDSN